MKALNSNLDSAVLGNGLVSSDSESSEGTSYSISLGREQQNQRY
jgi:hypothetical protein